MKTNPFPTLRQHVQPGKTTWEGDGRTIQVLAIEGRTGYTVTINGKDAHYDNAEQVLAAISQVPRVTGFYKQEGTNAHTNWSTSGGIPVRRVPISAPMGSKGKF